MICHTPYSLVFGTKAMIPTEVVILTERYEIQNQENNDKILAQDLDTVDELRDHQGLQQEHKSQKIPNRRLGIKENIPKHQGSPCR